MSCKWAGILASVSLGVGAISGVARAQGTGPSPFFDGGAPAAPPAPPRGVTLPPQSSEQTPVPRGPVTPGAPNGAEAPAPALFASRSWYGSEILISDGASAGLIGLSIGLALQNSTKTAAVETLLLGMGSYVLAPPIIHAAHGRWGIASASLSVRVFMPFVGAAAGTSDGKSCGADSIDICGRGAAVGALIGRVLASVLDAGLFSYERRSADVEASSRFGLSPALSADGKRGELSAFGTF